MITVEHLNRKFGDFIAVEDLSFEVEQGEIFAFLGPNGAGKTTTIKILTTLLPQTGGEVFINGYDPRKKKKEVRKSFGILFQDQSLDEDLTPIENLQLHAVLYQIPKARRGAKIQGLLEFVELWDRKNDRVKTFSGGMKRRLEIARALLHQPKILFLDEPTLGLDPQTRNHVWTFLRETNRKENTTIFFTTHYLEEAERIAGKLAIIDQGRLIATGTVKDILDQTSRTSLEDAFLSLTGKNIREEEAGDLDRLRIVKKILRK